MGQFHACNAVHVSLLQRQFYITLCIRWLSNLKCLQCHLLMLKHNSSSYILQWTQTLYQLFAKGEARERKGLDSTAVNVPSPFKKKKTKKTCRVSMFSSKLCSLNRTVFSNYQQIVWSFFSLVEAFKRLPWKLIWEYQIFLKNSYQGKDDTLIISGKNRMLHVAILLMSVSWSSRPCQRRAPISWGRCGRH